MKNPVTVCLLLAIAAPVSYAHHSIAIYNENELVSVTGNVVEWYRGRPHSYLRIDGSDELGNENTWFLDFGSTSVIVNTNEWDESTFDIGDEISVTGFPSRLEDTDILVESMVAPFGSFGMTESYFGDPEEAGPIPEWITLPAIELSGTIARSDWSDSSVTVWVPATVDGEAERDYEIRLSAPASLYDILAIAEEHVAPGNAARVDGYLADEGERLIVFPRIVDFGDRGPVRTAMMTRRAVAAYLGVEVQGRRGPPAGMGDAGAGRGGAGRNEETP